MFFGFFSFLITLVSVGALVLIVLLIVKSVEHSRRVRQEAFLKALEGGVYDCELLGRKRRSVASLGWGITFIAVGLALLIGFVSLGIIGDALIGALIPLFIGVGLTIFHVLVRRASLGTEANGEPISIAAKGETPVTIKSDGTREGGLD